VAPYFQFLLNARRSIAELLEVPTGHPTVPTPEHEFHASSLSLSLSHTRYDFFVPKAVYRTNVPLHMINSFLHTPTADNYLLANDISLIPRNVAHVRLIYKNMYVPTIIFAPVTCQPGITPLHCRAGRVFFK
jgi:hypothetical protein